MFSAWLRASSRRSSGLFLQLVWIQPSDMIQQQSYTVAFYLVLGPPGAPAGPAMAVQEFPRHAETSFREWDPFRPPKAGENDIK